MKTVPPRFLIAVVGISLILSTCFWILFRRQPRPENAVGSGPAIERNQEHEALESLQRSHEAAYRRAPEGSTQRAEAASGLGQAYMQQKKFKEAEGVWTEALGIWENRLSKNDVRIGDLLSNLAELHHFRQIRPEAAVPVYERLLRMHEDPASKWKFGPYPPFTARAVVAAHYKREARFAEAESILRKMLESLEGPKSKGGLGAMQILRELGSVCQAQKKFQDAEKFYRRAIVVQEAALAKNPTAMIQREWVYTIQLLGGLYHAQGRIREADAVANRIRGMEHVIQKPAGPSSRR